MIIPFITLAKDDFKKPDKKEKIKLITQKNVALATNNTLLKGSSSIFYPMRITVGSTCGLIYTITIDCDGSCNEASTISAYASYYLEQECARTTHFV